MTQDSKYLETYLSLIEHETISDNHFDPTIALYKAIDSLESKELNYVCQRKLQCKCKGLCTCDSDDFFPVSRLTTTMCSNNRYIFELLFTSKVSIKDGQCIRVFQMDEKNEEFPILDITFEYREDFDVMKGGKPLKYKYRFVRLNSDPETKYPILEGVNIDKHSISFCIDYMNYER